MSQSLSKSYRTTICETVLRAWNLEGVNYAVMHGLEGYPTIVGRDLDILVQANQIDSVIRITKRVLKEFALVVLEPSALWGRRLIALDGGWSDVIEIHTFSRLSWRNVVFVDKPCPSQSRGPFKIDQFAAFAKRVIIPILANDIERFRKRPHELCFNADDELNVVQMVYKLFGKKIGRDLCESIRSQNIEKIVKGVPELRKAVIFRAITNHPISSIKSSFHAVRRKAFQIFSPCAPLIALVGPDGVGKSTLIKRLSDGDKSIFTKIVTRHWRPEILPLLGTFLGKTHFKPTPDQNSPPRRIPGRFHNIRLLYYFVDFTLGYFLKDRVDSSLQRVVIYDRCALDMSVDPVRYGLSSNRGTRLLWRLIPKPDMVILLSDTPERIHSRKDELTEEEIENQLKQWRRLVEQGEVKEIVEMDAPIDELVERLRKLILKAFVEKNRCRNLVSII